MNKEETGKILSVITEVYPSFLRDRNIQATQNIWLTIFQEVSYDRVMQALTSYIATDTKGFPPVPGALNALIWQAEDAKGMSEEEAWSLVYRALRRSGYNSREEFEKLPEEIRRIVVHPSQLHEWAMLDEQEVNTVIAAGFKRSWRAARERAKTLHRLPQLNLPE